MKDTQNSVLEAWTAARNHDKTRGMCKGWLVVSNVLEYYGLADRENVLDFKYSQIKIHKGRNSNFQVDGSAVGDWLEGFFLIGSSLSLHSTLQYNGKRELFI